MVVPPDWILVPNSGRFISGANFWLTADNTSCVPAVVINVPIRPALVLVPSPIVLAKPAPNFVGPIAGIAAKAVATAATTKAV